MSLEEFREEIDSVNEEIVDAISERMRVVEEIKQYKEENNISTRDKGREKIVKDQFREKFRDRGLPGEKGEEFANKLIEMAVDKQEAEKP